MENNKNLKYQYHLCTWGGFYNEEYQKIHNEKSGDHWFDSSNERESYIKKLKDIEEKLGARHLALNTSEGYCCNITTKLHRVVEFENKRYYSENDLGINFPFNAAKYILEWKWTCGFNDYPLGEDFDYDNNPPKIIQEWITGACQELNQ